MAAAKKVKSPTGKPSKKKDAVKDFEKGKTSGGKRTSAYTKKTPAKKAAPKRKYGMDAPARRREKKAGT